MWPWWPWRRDCTPEQLGAVVAGLVRAEASVRPLVEAVQPATSLAPAELEWEVLALRLFYARVALGAKLVDAAPTLTALERAFLTEGEAAGRQAWLAARVAAYARAFGSATGGDAIVRVGLRFAEFARLPRGGLDTLRAAAGAAAVDAGISRVLRSVRVVGA